VGLQMYAGPLTKGSADAHGIFKTPGAAMYSKILVPVDGSEASTCGLHEAIRIAKEQDSKLRLLHIVKAPLLDYGYNSGLSRNDVIASLCRAGKNILNAAEIAARREGLAPECMLFESIGGPAADVILDQAKQWSASLIVMGNHTCRGPVRIGSDTAAVLGEASVPVLLVRGTPLSSEDSEHKLLDYEYVAA
jgi:nucleotide-binding universal stress UspA family protein